MTVTRYTNAALWPFYDGDFTFHAKVYPSGRRQPFRVRIDSTPEKRAHENLTNPNKSEPGWKRITHATTYEAVQWCEHFKRDWPLRPDTHTRALKAMNPERFGQPLTGGPTELRDACEALCLPINVVRDFKPVSLTFAREIEPGVFYLTDDGEWLSNLIS